jgi:CheY-like chemotaxis protein
MAAAAAKGWQMVAFAALTARVMACPGYHLGLTPHDLCMTTTHRIALLGFSAFETSTLASSFRLGSARSHRYEPVALLAGSELALVAADHAASVQQVVAADRQALTVFVGGRAPAGAGAWLPRPIAASLVLRELDALVTLLAARQAAGADEPTGPDSEINSEGDSLADTVAGALDEPPLAGSAPAPVALPATALPVSALPVTAKLAAPAQAPAEAKAQPPLASQSLPEPEPEPEPEAEPAPDPQPQPVAVPPAAPQREPLKTLLVDDSDLALRFLQSRLAPWALRIDRATTDIQAFQRLDRQDYDLVFLDVELGPNSAVDGLAVCQHIKRRPAAGAAAHAMVVMVSAHAAELDRVRGSLAGCDGYLAKPLDEGELHRLMHRLRVPEIER